MSVLWLEADAERQPPGFWCAKATAHPREVRWASLPTSGTHICSHSAPSQTQQAQPGKQVVDCWGEFGTFCFAQEKRASGSGTKYGLRWHMLWPVKERDVRWRYGKLRKRTEQKNIAVPTCSVECLGIRKWGMYMWKEGSGVSERTLKCVCYVLSVCRITWSPIKMLWVEVCSVNNFLILSLSFAFGL